MTLSEDKIRDIFCEILPMSTRITSHRTIRFGKVSNLYYRIVKTVEDDNYVVKFLGIRKNRRRGGLSTFYLPFKLDNEFNTLDEVDSYLITIGLTE